MPYIYDYDETANVNNWNMNKKFVFIGDSSNKAKLTYEAPKHLVDLPTKMSYTEAEFIQICNDGMACFLPLGATITLSNTYCSTYEVIGVNHDGTKGTVDIMAHTQVDSMAFGSDSTMYSTSTVRTWINGTYLSAFSSTIQGLAKTMDIHCNTDYYYSEYVLQDKVKILSVKELNASTYPYTNNTLEGEAYTVFTAGAYGTSISDRWRDAGTSGSSSAYWLRSYGSSTINIIVNNIGTIYSNAGILSNSYGVLPVLRFGSPCRTIVNPTKDSFTEDEFIEICNNGLQQYLSIGAKITLSNTYCSTYEVIGVNHDSTTNTVDIMPTTQVGNMQFSASSNEYETSSIRTWINGTYLSAFSSTIQSLAKTMSVVSNSTTLQDKVKLLSCTELFYSSGVVEGESYTYITSNRWRPAGTYGNSSYYWTRTLYSTDSVYSCYCNGTSFYRIGYSNTYGVLPVLRF